MRHALRHIARTAGSVEAYLLEAGFSADDMQRLRAALLRPAAGGSGSSSKVAAKL